MRSYFVLDYLVSFFCEYKLVDFIGCVGTTDRKGNAKAHSENLLAGFGVLGFVSHRRISRDSTDFEKEKRIFGCVMY